MVGLTRLSEEVAWRRASDWGRKAGGRVVRELGCSAGGYARGDGALGAEMGSARCSSPELFPARNERLAGADAGAAKVGEAAEEGAAFLVTGSRRGTDAV